MKPTLKVLVGACLVVLLLAGATTLATLPLIASTVAGERVSAMLSSLHALVKLPLIVGTEKGEQIKGTRNAEMIMGLGGR